MLQKGGTLQRNVTIGCRLTPMFSSDPILFKPKVSGFTRSFCIPDAIDGMGNIYQAISLLNVAMFHVAHLMVFFVALIF